LEPKVKKARKSAQIGHRDFLKSAALGGVAAGATDGPSDVAEIYDRYDYAVEKRIALKQLDVRLRQIIRREPKMLPFDRSQRMRAAGWYTD
jgi:hypothetical protein